MVVAIARTINALNENRGFLFMIFPTANCRLPISESDHSLLNRQLAIGIGYGCGTDAVAGFLLLNSLMNARVMSMLSAA